MAKSPLAGHLKCVIAVVLAAVLASVGTWAVMAQSAPGAAGGPVVGKLKAAWIYVGPIADIGWTHAHDQGRLYVDQKFDWLVTHYVESVKPQDCPAIIDQLVEAGYTLIFTTSYDFKEATLEAAEKYPNIIFFHCSGEERRRNVGTYFAEFYQLYYLNGLMAGALTRTGKAAYVAAKPIPEVIRHINAFAIGFAEVAMQRYERGELPNPPVVYVDWLFEWYNPPKAKQMAETFITQYGCDVIAFTEDSTAVVEACEDYYVKYTHGEWPWPVYTFAHYSPMLDHGPDVVVSGQLVHWEVIYEDIVMKVALGVYTPENLENVDYWWMLREGAVELGCDYGVPINPEFEDDLRAVTVTDKLTGQSMSVYDLVMLRLAQMSEEVPTFDPFTGPLYDQNGNLRVPEGVRLGHDDLWTMMWFVEWVVGTIPS